MGREGREAGREGEGRGEREGEGSKERGGGKWGERGREAGREGEGSGDWIPPCPPPQKTLIDTLDIILEALDIIFDFFYIILEVFEPCIPVKLPNFLQHRLMLQHHKALDKMSCGDWKPNLFGHNLR